MKKDVIEITKFLHSMHNLKQLLRFKGMPGWDNTSIDRWDSVAEHSYRMALMAVLYHQYIKPKPNLEQVLKMILVHDIVELIANDYSPMKGHNNAGGHAFNDKAYEDKYERENAAANLIFKDLPQKIKKECIYLWKEYANAKLHKEKATKESKYAYALDKLEAGMQIIDWNDKNVTWSTDRTERTIKYIKEWSNYDKTLKTVAEILELEIKMMEKSDGNR